MSEKKERKDRLLLVGAGGFGRIAAELAAEKYDCAFVDDGCEVGTRICGISVVGQLSDLKRLRESYELLVVVIGNNHLREKVYQKAKELGYRFPNLVSKSAYISPFARLGQGCVVLNHAVIQNGANIGDGVLLNAGVEIHCDSVVDHYVLIYANSVIRTNARIGSRACIGSNSTVGNGIVVPDDADIGNCVAL